MAVQAQQLGCVPFGGLADGALWDLGALFLPAGAAGSGLTCTPSPSSSNKKRGRDGVIDDPYAAASCSSVELLPIPGMIQPSAAMSRVTCSAMENSSATEALVVAALYRQQVAAEVEELIRAECDRVRAGLEQAHKRQRLALAQFAVAAAARRLRHADAELCAARRRAAELEERLRQVAAESHAWQGLARGHEATAAALEHHLMLLLRGAAADAVEGFGESGDGEVSPPNDDAQSCCFVEAKKDVDVATATSSPATKWACKACGVGEATVLLLPCRHLCLCKVCEPRMNSCPACLAVKNASIHVALN
ncbi:hypothetical protein QOZ80_9BG0712600 [Eleusine coracana subsp. coracana]|nr:hypothetical protein QOZ80_9BG0712600 [Eleusine coracana subsp. coracana]